MTRFGCTTCWKLFDDKHIKYWKSKPVCERCYDKYERLSKPVRFVDKIDEQIEKRKNGVVENTRPNLSEQDYGGDPT